MIDERQMTDEQFELFISKARLACARMEAVEARTGLTSPRFCPVVEHARTAKAALQLAIQAGSWDEAAEAYVMLGELIERLRGAQS